MASAATLLNVPSRSAIYAQFSPANSLKGSGERLAIAPGSPGTWQKLSSGMPRSF